MAERTIQDLWQMQGLPLSVKVKMTQQRIRDWVYAYGEDGVYVSFSGGKDSTVLLHLVRELYPNVKAVFVDTGLEYPEIRKFVKTFDNVEWLKPKLTFKQVIQKYGYPFISKEVSECVQGARKYLTQIIAESSLDRPTDRPTDTVQVLVRESYWNGRIPKASNRADIINTSTKRTEYLERTDKASIARNTRGGYDNKWRKARGIGEYSKRQNDQQGRRSESATCDHVRDANERQGSSDKGEYP